MIDKKQLKYIFMRKFSTYFMLFLMMIGMSVNAQDLVITGAVDGPLSGGVPKAVEFYAINDIADLSVYGFGSANNGGGSDGEEFTFPAISVDEGDYIYIGSDSTGFFDFFGFYPLDRSDAANINGDDAIELFMSGSVVDVFGDIDVDGTGEPWEYLDGWVYRNDQTGPDGTTFVEANWQYSGVDALEGETTNASAANPWPLGTYTAGAATTVATPLIQPASGGYIDPISVTMTCSTDGATIYYTTDGTDPDENDSEYTNSFQISTTTTVKAKAFKTGLTPSNVATNQYNFPIDISNIATLRNQSGGDEVYKLTGEAILTYQQDYRGQKYIQDATAGILIDDDEGLITTSYNIYDGITNIYGELTTYGDMLQFVPITDPGAASSSGNSITPVVITLSDLTSDFEDYEAELVKVEGCVFADAGGTFENGTVYVITDGSKATYNFRTTFYDVDYIGTEIPATPMDLVMIPNSRTDGEYATSRDLNDMTGGATNPATQLNITSVNGGADVYENQPFTVSVQALDADGNPAVVDANVNVSLSVGTGSGSLGGTTTGVISSGTTSTTISGVTYGPHENGVVLNVSGGSLTTGNSDPFDVLEVVIPDILITEVMYNATPGTDTLEYIEFYNNGSSAINLENYEITQGVEFTFGNYTLNAGAYVLVASRADMMQSVFGVTALEWTSGGLSNGGEDIELTDADGNVVTYIDYLTVDPWPANETGRSIRFCDYGQAQNNGANWSLSSEFIDTYEGQDLYGTPGAACGDDPDPLVADFSGTPTTLDMGGSVDFTDLSEGDPTGWSWSFSGGSPSTSSSQNPQDIVYSAAGTYDVTLTITRGADSDTETKVAYITVNDPTVPPIADFSADVTTVFVGQTVQFTDLSQNTPTSYEWTFEGGTPASSSNQNPMVTYNTPGTFDVTLFVENTAGDDELTMTDYITVLPATVGDLVITEIMYNPPESGTDSLEYIEIYNNSDDEVNLLGYAFTAGVEFAFPDMSLENGEYLLVAVNAAAMQSTFGVTALEWTSGGLSNTGELIRLTSPAGITVDSVEYSTSAPWPTEANGNGPSITICNPETENSVGDNWHASVNMIGTNGNGDFIYGSPLMAPAPVADFEANITELMGTGSVEFTELSICNATSFAWEFEGGTPATSSDPNPTVTYNMAGDFDVTLTVTNETGSHSITMEEYIHVGVGFAEQNMDGIAVMPNPSTGVFRLSNPSAQQLNIRVYSILGTQILEKQAIESDELIDLSEYENGVYLLQLQMGDDVKSMRIIKK
jgi:PKD repeat protein